MNAKNVEKLATGLSRPLLRGFSNYHHMGQVAFVFVIHLKPIFQTHRHLIDNDDLTPGFSLKEFSLSPCLKIGTRTASYSYYRAYLWVVQWWWLPLLKSISRGIFRIHTNKTPVFTTYAELTSPASSWSFKSFNGTRFGVVSL